MRLAILVLVCIAVNATASNLNHGDVTDYVTSDWDPSLPAQSTFNGTDGVLCGTNHTLAWLDLVIVLESTRATASQWQAIVGNILTYLMQLSLSNSANVAHTSRVAIITYDSSPNPVQHYAFTDRQTVHSIQFALNAAKPNTTSSKGNIASGLRAANNYLATQNSFRVKGVILYAATYDDSGTNNPVEAATELKGDLIKIATISYDAANGVNTPKISELSSPGLALTSLDSLASFATMISQLNCRCPAGWTQLVVNNVVFYADCFYYQFSINFPGCDGSTILAVANTPARLDFITQLASNWTTVPTSEINVGLVRYDANSPWIWEDGEAYTAFPVFAQTPSETNTYGYLAKTNNYNWQLLSDDSLNTRQYVCQRRACDANHLCDLSI